MGVLGAAARSLCSHRNSRLVALNVKKYYLAPYAALLLAVVMQGAAQRLAQQATFRGSVFGRCLMLPVRDGRFVFGTWQGIYLCTWANQKDLEVC